MSMFMNSSLEDFSKSNNSNKKNSKKMYQPSCSNSSNVILRNDKNFHPSNNAYLNDDKDVSMKYVEHPEFLDDTMLVKSDKYSKSSKSKPHDMSNTDSIIKNNKFEDTLPIRKEFHNSKKLNIDNIYNVNSCFDLSNDTQLWYIVENSSIKNNIPYSSKEIIALYNQNRINDKTKLRLIDIFKMKNSDLFDSVNLQEIVLNDFIQKIEISPLFSKLFSALFKANIQQNKGHHEISNIGLITNQSMFNETQNLIFDTVLNQTLSKQHYITDEFDDHGYIEVKGKGKRPQQEEQSKQKNKRAINVRKGPIGI